jgi:SAM-dependent methyltransferase
MPEENAPLPHEIIAYYQKGQEAQRLLQGSSRLELARTQEILLRHLPAPPGVIADVGGGPGVYAAWLAGLGYTVHLVDATPLHVEQARQASSRHPAHPLASCAIGDARWLHFPGEIADGVLLLGPLYHLTRQADRLATLREAGRVLKPGGVLVAAAISRFASLLDGLVGDYLFADPDYLAIVSQDLQDGQHRNISPDQDYFTTAYFHRPEELATEIKAAGMSVAAVLAVEGVGWLLGNFAAWWENPARRADLLSALRWLEAEPALLGASAHWLAIAHKGD